MKAHKAASGALPETLHPEQRLRLAQVEALTGAGSTWIYNEIRAGRFPEPEKDGPRNSRWRAGDVLDWLKARTKRNTEQVQAARRGEQAARLEQKARREQEAAA